MNVGMVGAGVVGDAMARWFRRHNRSVKLFFHDLAKGMDDDFSKVDVVFI